MRGECAILRNKLKLKLNVKNIRSKRNGERTKGKYFCNLIIFVFFSVYKMKLPKKNILFEIDGVLHQNTERRMNQTKK